MIRRGSWFVVGVVMALALVQLGEERALRLRAEARLRAVVVRGRAEVRRARTRIAELESALASVPDDRVERCGHVLVPAGGGPMRTADGRINLHLKLPLQHHAAEPQPAARPRGRRR